MAEVQAGSVSPGVSRTAFWGGVSALILKAFWWIIERFDDWGRVEFISEKVGWLLKFQDWPMWVWAALKMVNDYLVPTLLFFAVPVLALDLWSRRGDIATRGVRAIPSQRKVSLLCVNHDLPFTQSEIAKFPPEEADRRVKSYRWVPLPPSGVRLVVQRALAALRLTDPPSPILLFKVDEQSGRDGFVTVTNYGATAEVAAWAMVPLSAHKLPGAAQKYPVNWQENAQRTIRLRRNESATLHLVHSEIVRDAPTTTGTGREGDYILSYENLKDWQIVTLMGADGKDASRQFLSHPLYWNDGVVSFILMLECPSKPITEPPASAYYQIENIRESANLRITRRE